MPKKRESQRIWSLLRPERYRYLLGLLALFVVNLCDALAPVFMAVAIDLTEANLTQTSPRTPTILAWLGLSSQDFQIAGAVFVYLSMMILANVARYPMLMYTAIPSHRIGQGMRRALAEHLLRLAQPFYDRSRTGDLMSLATSDIQAIRMMLGPGILVGTDTIFLLTLVLVVMFALSWQLALVALIPLPLIAIVTNRLSHAEFDRFEASQEELATLTERTRESFAGVRIIQGYAQEEFDRARFAQYSLRYYTKTLALARVRAVFDPTLDWMMGASTALVFIFGGLAVLSKSLSLGTFVAFIFLVNYLSGPMVGFGWAVSLWQRGRASLSRLDAFLDQPVTIQDAPTAKPHELKGAISVRGLSFHYQAPRTLEEDDAPDTALATALADDRVTPTPQGSLQALEDISFELPAGSTLGIIGPVGSGKSTLAKLLTRLYEPPTGTIFIDGVELHDITLASLRRQIVLAPQDNFLFGDTIARNVLLYDPTQAEHAEQFTQQAHLHTEIDALKEGYDTMLGERGVNLSGGQRQRLAIARAIATDPRLLILDDCLSAVDARTEEAILQNLRAVFDNRTGIIISHRVRAVQRCDLIMVLEAGRLIELGSHDALLAKGGYYARIAHEQTHADTPAASTTPASFVADASAQEQRS